MKFALRTMLITGTMASAIALGAIAAHADDDADLKSAQDAAAALDAATGGDNFVSRALKDPETKKSLQQLIEAIGGSTEE